MWSFLVGGSNNDSVDSVDDSDSSSSSIVFANIVTGCSKSNHTQYLEHDKDTWTLLQQAHDRVKGKRSHYKAHHTGMMVPFEIRSSSSSSIGDGRDSQNGNDERYLYVTEDVQQGTQLWQPLHYVTFHSQNDYVKFLIEVSEHYLQCEVLSWTHPSIHQINGTDMYVDITLDEGTFIAEVETAQQQQQEEEIANIDINCRAIREIKAGEKIIMNGSTEYSDTINKKEVDWFNNIRESAWKRTGLGQQQRVHQGYHQQHTATPTLEGGSNNFAIAIAPTTSMVVLSAMFFVVKIIRGSRTKKQSSSFSSISYGDDNSDDNGTAYSYFCSNNNKSKIA